MTYFVPEAQRLLNQQFDQLMADTHTILGMPEVRRQLDMSLLGESATRAVLEIVDGFYMPNVADRVSVPREYRNTGRTALVPLTAEMWAEGLSCDESLFTDDLRESEIEEALINQLGLTRPDANKTAKQWREDLCEINAPFLLSEEEIATTFRGVTPFRGNPGTSYIGFAKPFTVFNLAASMEVAENTTEMAAKVYRAATCFHEGTHVWQQNRQWLARADTYTIATLTREEMEACHMDYLVIVGAGAEAELRHTTLQEQARQRLNANAADPFDPTTPGLAEASK